MDETSENDEQDLMDEWKNKLLRESIAKNSLLKIKNSQYRTFFSKGKLYSIGDYIRRNDINIVFINSDLSNLQINSLEK